MRTFIVMLLFVSVSSFSSAQPRKSDAETLQQLLGIEAKIAQANSSCDYDYFRSVEAKEFIFTDSQGNVTTRDQDLAGEKDCKKNTDSHNFDEPRLLRYATVVLLNARQTIAGDRNGKAFRVQTRFTDVFVWRDGRWQLVAGHSSRIPNKSP